MKISLIQVGKTQDKHLRDFIDDYRKRISHYVSFDIITIKEAQVNKNENKILYQKKEADEILKCLRQHPFPILLDELGKQYSSVGFAKQCQKWFEAHHHISFVIGGAYGFHPSIIEKGFAKIALSKMTFTHQWARLILVEQIYRSMTILNNQSYHH